MIATVVLMAMAPAFLQGPALKDHSPIVLPAVMNPGRCRIPVAVAGKSYLFLLDSGMERSYIREDVKNNALKRDPAATLGLEEGTVLLSDVASKKSSVYQEVPAIAGILGMDILSKLAFTVDYDSKSVTVWPEKTLTKNLDSSVVKSGEEAVSIDIITPQDTPCPFVQTSYGLAELDTGAALSLLPKTASASPEVFATKITRPLEMFDGTAGLVTQAIVRNFEVGSEKLFCQPMLLSDTAENGIISPNLFGHRILFDFPRKRIAFAEPTSSESACRVIGTLLHGNVEDRDGQLFLKALLPVGPSAKEDPWVRIVSINGTKGSDLLALIKGGDSSSVSLLVHTYNDLGRSGKVLIEQGNKQMTLAVQQWATGP